MTLMAIVVAMLLAAGCGGGGDGDGSTAEARGSQEETQAPSEGDSSSESSSSEGGKPNGSDAALIKQADAVCNREGKRYRQEITEHLTREGKSGQGEAQALEEIVETVAVPRVESEIEGLEMLSGSPGGEAAVGQMIEKLEAAIAAAEADPVSFAEGGVPAVAESERTGQELGFSKCGPLD